MFGNFWKLSEGWFKVVTMVTDQTIILKRENNCNTFLLLSFLHIVECYRVAGYSEEFLFCIRVGQVILLFFFFFFSGIQKLLNLDFFPIKREILGHLNYSSTKLSSLGSHPVLPSTIQFILPRSSLQRSSSSCNDPAFNDPVFNDPVFADLVFNDPVFTDPAFNAKYASSWEFCRPSGTALRWVCRLRHPWPPLPCWLSVRTGTRFMSSPVCVDVSAWRVYSERRTGFRGDLEHYAVSEILWQRISEVELSTSLFNLFNLERLWLFRGWKEVVYRRHTYSYQILVRKCSELRASENASGARIERKTSLGWRWRATHVDSILGLFVVYFVFGPVFLARSVIGGNRYCS